MPIPQNIWEYAFPSQDTQLRTQIARENLLAAQQDRAQELARQNALIDLYNQPMYRTVPGREAVTAQVENPEYQNYLAATMGPPAPTGRDWSQLRYPGSEPERQEPALTRIIAPAIPTRQERIPTQQLQNYGQVVAMQQHAQQMMTQFTPMLTAALELGEGGEDTKNAIAERMVQSGNPLLVRAGEIVRQAKFNADGTVAYTGEQLQQMDEGTLRGLGLTPGLAASYRPDAQIKFKGQIGRMRPTEVGRDQYAIEDIKTERAAMQAQEKRELEKVRQQGLEQRQRQALDVRLQGLQMTNSRFNTRLQQQQFGVAVRPFNTSLGRALQTSNAAAGFEEKLQTNVATTKELINDYVKKHPGAQKRIGGLLSDIWNKRIARSGDIAALYDHFESINMELAKLESGSLGTAGVTKHARDGFSGMSVASGLDNVNARLDNMLVMTHNAKKAQEQVTQKALGQVNSVRRQFGQMPLSLESANAAAAEVAVTPETTEAPPVSGDVVSLLESERQKLEPGQSKRVEVDGTMYDVYRPIGTEGGGAPPKPAKPERTPDRQKAFNDNVERAKKITTFAGAVSFANSMKKKGWSKEEAAAIFDAAGLSRFK